MQKTVIPEPHKNITFWTRCISVVSHSHRKNKKETVKDTVKKDVKKYTTTLEKSVGKKKKTFYVQDRIYISIKASKTNKSIIQSGNLKTEPQICLNA